MTIAELVKRLREAAQKAAKGEWLEEDSDEKFSTLANPENILKLLDAYEKCVEHIKGQIRRNNVMAGSTDKIKHAAENYRAAWSVLQSIGEGDKNAI